MKIVYVIEATGGGSGKICLLNAGSMADKGHAVTLIYSPHRADKQFFDLLAQSKNIRAIEFPMQRAIGVHDVLDLYRLGRILKTLGPFDIIHSHSSKAGALTRIASLFLPSAKKIHTSHGLITMGPAIPRLYGYLELGMSWLSDANIMVSTREKNHALAQGFQAHKLCLIPNGISPYKADQEKAVQILGFGTGHFVIGIVGRLTTQKRHDRAIESFAKIAGQYPNARMAIVGYGDLKIAIQNQIKNLNLDNRIKIFEGHDARDLMPAFDVLLCASDFEGFALVFPEALSAGIPIITTRVGVAEETVIEGKTGFIAGDFTAQSLAQTLQKIMDMTDQDRAQMLPAIQQKATEFTTDKMNEKLEWLYQSLF